MKKTWKSAVSMCLAVLMLVLTLPPLVLEASASAAQTLLVQETYVGTLDGYEWSPYSNNTAYNNMIILTGVLNPETGMLTQNPDEGEWVTFIAKYENGAIVRVSDYYYDNTAPFTEKGYSVFCNKDYICTVFDANLNDCYPNDELKNVYGANADGITASGSVLRERSEEHGEIWDRVILNYENGTYTSRDEYDAAQPQPMYEQDTGKYHYVDSTGAQVFPGSYTMASSYYNGYAAVKNTTVVEGVYETVYGLLDPQGNMTYSSSDAIGSVNSEGLATLMSKSGVSYIDPYGKVVIPGDEYSEMGYNFNNHAVTAKGKDGYYYLIDASGRKLFRDVESPWRTSCPAIYATVYGLYNTKGESIFSIQDDATIQNLRVSNTGLLWVEHTDSTLEVIQLPVDETIHYPTYEETPTVDPSTGDAETGDEYIYDVPDPGDSVKVPASLLDTVVDSETAAEVVRLMVDAMTDEQKASATGIDLATLFAEMAAASAASIDVASDEIINAALLNQVKDIADVATSMVAEELAGGGIDVLREIPKTVILSAGSATSLDMRIDPDVLDTDVDKVRVETDQFAITFNLNDLAVDLNAILEFKAEVVGGAGTAANQMVAMPTSAGGAGMAARAVTLALPDGGLTKPVTLSLPTDEEDTTYLTMKLNGAATPSKYNPATITIDGKTTLSGTYTTEENEVDFSDIANKSAEMQNAIRVLASRGVLAGTTANTFSPDGTITRAEIATLVARILGLYDERVTPTYTDVTTADWFYVGAASCQKHDLMSGYGDNMFHGRDVISKEQIVVASGNVMVQYMNYKIPADPETRLANYNAGLPSWGRDKIAVAIIGNVMIPSADRNFRGSSTMTRGNAAIIMYNLFERIW